MTETYTYAGDGKRRQKVTASGTTNFIWDGENVLAEQDQGQVTQVQYTHAPGTWGGLMSQRRSGVSSFYSSDMAGNTRALVSSAPAVTDSYSYKAFGPELTVSGSTSNAYRYGGSVGYYRDSATRQYVRARHLSVSPGRWMSRDPRGLASGDLNPYRYAADAPTAFTDPSGEQAQIVVGGVVVAIIVIGGILILVTTICHRRRRRQRCILPPVGDFPPIWPIVGRWQPQSPWVAITQRAYMEIMTKGLSFLSQTTDWKAAFARPRGTEKHHVFPCDFVNFFDAVLGPGENDNLTITVPTWANDAFHATFGGLFPPPPFGGWWNNRWELFFRTNAAAVITASCVLGFGDAMRAAVKIQDRDYETTKNRCKRTVNA